MDPRTDPPMDPPMDRATVAGPAQPPTSVRVAVWLVWGVVAVSGLTALLTVLLRDQLLASWQEGRSPELDPPAFVPVAITLFVVVALLGWVLAVFFRNGHGWARWSIAALVVFAAFSAAIGLNGDLPPAFVILTALSLFLYAALLVVLFHKDTNAYLHRA